ncbi:MAG: hypothetical protein M3017_13235, partial [Actinomycetota bacterium]|nr:hypothetical protein [Actinomycetota bacterium]
MPDMGRPTELADFREWPVEGLESLAFHFPVADSKCGIYILSFGDGARYVGKSLNAVRRFADHRRRWNDITSIAFKAYPSEDLGRQERAVLRSIESEGHHVRNLDLAG